MISPVRPTPTARKLAVLPYSAARPPRRRAFRGSWARRVRSRAALVVGGLDPERQLDPPHPLEDPLGHHPLAGEQVADHPEGEELHRGDEEDRAEDQRLDVAGAVAVEDRVDQERQPGGEGEQEDDGAGGGEGAQRLVAGVDAEDRRAVAAHVAAGRVEEPGLAGLRVGPDLDLVDGDQHLAGLDQALQRVGEVVDDESRSAASRL